MSEPIDVKDFAKRVERLCDFLLDKMDKDGSVDLKVIQDLKEEAANLQFEEPTSKLFVGLYEYMKGVDEP